MFRPTRSIVLPFRIKKASLALRMESRLETIFSMGINMFTSQKAFRQENITY